MEESFQIEKGEMKTPRNNEDKSKEGKEIKCRFLIDWMDFDHVVLMKEFFST